MAGRPHSTAITAPPRSNAFTFTRSQHNPHPIPSNPCRFPRRTLQNLDNPHAESALFTLCKRARHPTKSRRLTAPQPIPPRPAQPQPDGSRVKLSVDPVTRTVTFRWRAVGGPGITILLLVMLAPFAVVSAFMAFAAMRSLGQASGSAISPLLIAAVLLMAIVIWLLVYLVVEAHFAWQQVLTISPEFTHGRLQGGISGRVIGSLRQWQQPTSHVRNVRVHDDDAIEFAGKGPTRRMLVHLPAPGECEWLAETVSEICRHVSSTDGSLKH